MNPFDFVNSINSKSSNLLDENPNNENHYDSFLTNRSFSYFPDSVLYANEMNSRHFLDKKLQYDYLYHGVGKKKRFSRWASKNTSGEIEFLVRLYECSKSKAGEILAVLGEETVQKLRKEYPEFDQ
jgi:hypothetical protein